MTTGVDADAHFGFATAKHAAPVPVWAPTEPDDVQRSDVLGPKGAGDTQRGPTGGVRELPHSGERSSRRPRGGLLVALLAFYCLQFGAAYVAWWQAPIRTEALVEPMAAYAICTVLVVPALLLRGRWRAVPALIGTVLGTIAPLWLVRDLIGIVGPRDVWVGQSLTLQVFFPLVVGLAGVIAVLTAPRPVAAHVGSGAPG